MVIILSPAKKMRADEGLFWEQLPQQLARTETLLDALQAMTPRALKELWRCSEDIASLNLDRLSRMDLRRGLTPALTAYDGIAFRYMAPNVFTDGQLDYVKDHLRILSGFYGALRPFDGVTPYRLEMGAHLAVGGKRDLYDFWGDSIARTVLPEDGRIVDLASKEYSRAVTPFVPRACVTAVVFAQRQGDKLIEKGTLCKMARGEMVRWMAENDVEDVADLRGFDQLGYRWSKDESNETAIVFIKEEYHA